MGAKTSRKSLLRRVEKASKVNFGLHIDVTRRLMLSSLAAFSFIWAASRSVKGTVRDQNGRKLTRAVVYLKDTRSLRIRSFLTRKDGTFEFHGVDANIDYELWARFGKINSATKSLSRFNSEDPVIVDLTIDLA